MRTPVTQVVRGGLHLATTALGGSGVLWYGVVWCGMVWYGLVNLQLYGMVWSATVWYGMDYQW